MITPKVGLSGQFVTGTDVAKAARITAVNSDGTVDAKYDANATTVSFADNKPFVDVGGTPPTGPGGYFQAIDPTT
jgi:dUTPase